MTSVVRSVDPVSGSVDWVEDDDFDLHQEIARSTYADMIHDHERNEKYYLALEKAIKKMKEDGRKANVLDIGTGTGLLSMMAARLGADSIVACEAFAPMYKCAKEIIKANGFADRIHVVSKHSKHMTVGPEGDMECRANILVTEVFDSDFIGEGALLTFKHALEELLEEDSIVVPSSGRVFAQVIESEMVRRWNKLDDIVVSDNNVLKVPNTLERCPGTYSVHDLQLSQFPVDQFKTVFEPHIIFSFDFLGKTKLEFNRHNETNGVASISGNAHAVFMWWELTMDIDDEIILSCAPHWAHPSPEAKNGPDAIPWRDHWMQEIYYLPKDVPVTKGQNLKLISNHDEFGFWFNLFPYNDKITDKDDTEDCIRPACTCNLHLICSYTRIGMLNDPLRRQKYLSALKRKINSKSVVLSIGDCSLLGLMAVSLGAKMVYCEDVSMFARPIISEFIKTNNLSDKIQLLTVKYDNIGNVKKTDDLLQIIKKVDLIITEPFFSSAFLPWHHLRWKPSECLEKCLVFPNEAVIWAVAVQFDHLYKIRAPLNTVFDFSMTECDELIANASVVSDSPIELQPLWEYGTVSLSRPFKLFQLNLNSDYPEKDKNFHSTVNIEASGRLDAIVLWIEHKLDDDISVSNGIITDVTSVKPGEKIKWDMYTRQAVSFVKQYYPLLVSQSDELSIDAIFQCKNSDLLLNTNLRCANGDVFKDVTGKPSSKFSYLMNEGNN